MTVKMSAEEGRLNCNPNTDHFEELEESREENKVEKENVQSLRG